jgi:2-polyprenyl-6-hydroxyphenyl methylase/3-demethylubiquinone-9 3-methyltransferase
VQPRRRRHEIHCHEGDDRSRQITPLALTKAFADPDRAAAKRAFVAMRLMKKIDIAAIGVAVRG